MIHTKRYMSDKYEPQGRGLSGDRLRSLGIRHGERGVTAGHICGKKRLSQTYRVISVPGPVVPTRQPQTKEQLVWTRLRRTLVSQSLSQSQVYMATTVSHSGMFTARHSQVVIAGLPWILSVFCSRVFKAVNPELSGLCGCRRV